MRVFSYAAAAALVAMSVHSAAFADEVAPPASASADRAQTGDMLYSSTGHRIGSVYRVTSEGNPQVILDGRLITVPASSLSEVSGKLTTSLSKRDLARLK